MPHRRRTIVKRRRRLPSRILRRAGSQFVALSLWLKALIAVIVASFIVLATISVEWGAWEWARFLATLCCVAGMLAALLWIIDRRE